MKDYKDMREQHIHNLFLGEQFQLESSKEST